MPGIDAFRFDGKRALVVGGASGMGAAAADVLLQLGATVVVMDYAPVTLAGVESISVDLRDQASIEAAVDACAGPVDALLSCAGVAPGADGIERVNFIGQRHLIERVIDQEKMPKGSSIVMVSSIAGYGWEDEIPLLLEYLDTPDFDSAMRWIDAHPDKAKFDYPWSKEAVNAYVGRQAFRLNPRGIRINALLPGVVDTPLGRASGWVDDWEAWHQALDAPPNSPEGIAYPLAFLCSEAAQHVNGTTLIVDDGYVNAGLTGEFQNRFAARGTAPLA